MERDCISLAVIGAGGNIGSHIVPHLARMPGVARLTLVDPGRYEAKDLRGQSLCAAEVGRPKAEVQAEVARRISPDIEACALVAPVQDVPAGRLRSDALLTGLDSRRARMAVNQAAWRLGVPWIDAGVDAGNMLARVNVYVPDADAPCLECAWDQRDYDALEQVYACDDGREPPPTDAPSPLGALAASLQVIALGELLEGRGTPPAGGQLLLAARDGRLFLTFFRRNRNCRFDHQTWRIEAMDRSPSGLTLDEAFALGPGGTDEGVALAAEGRAIIRALTCPDCGHRAVVLCIEGRLSPHQRTCPQCGEPTVAAGADMVQALRNDAVSAEEVQLTMADAGFRPGDLFVLRQGDRAEHYQFPLDHEGEVGHG